jgi:RNA polymerase primary sigma factor
MQESLYSEIERALTTLPEREAIIIKHFFGIGETEMSLREIGDKLGLTRERVRQLKERALRKLRKTSRSIHLKTYLG